MSLAPVNKFFRFIFCFAVLIVAGCETHRVTLYSYNGVDLTRIDKDVETLFYYGDFRDRRDLPNEYIKSTYSGFTYLMSSYVIFNNDKTITFVDMGDGIEKKGKSPNLNILEHRDNISFIKWQATFQGKFDSLLRIDDALKVEQKINKENKSKVKAFYSH